MFEKSTKSKTKYNIEPYPTTSHYRKKQGYYWRTFSVATINKIFNKNNIKVSYSCMLNVKSKINAHNKRILSSTNVDIVWGTPSALLTTLPNQEHCLWSYSLLRLAKLRTKKVYSGLCEGTFKKGFLGTSQFSKLHYFQQTFLENCENKNKRNQ